VNEYIIYRSCVSVVLTDEFSGNGGDPFFILCQFSLNTSASSVPYVLARRTSLSFL
jgi:chemotaxis receptor (MCP) glutamine deamidase CheD